MIAQRGSAGRADRTGRGRRPLTRLGAAVLAVGTSALLAGCAAGQSAQSVQQTPVVDGVSANVGSINIRAASVVDPADGSIPKGGDAKLQLYIVNSGTTDDALVGVTTDQAASAGFFADASSVTAPLPSPAGSPSDSAAPTAGSTDSSGSAGASSSAGTSGTGTATQLQSIKLPAGQTVAIGHAPDEKVILLQGLTGDLFPAQSFKITFTFARAGAVTFSIAVHLAEPPASPATGPISASSAEG